MCIVVYPDKDIENSGSAVGNEPENMVSTKFFISRISVETVSISVIPVYPLTENFQGTWNLLVRLENRKNPSTEKRLDVLVMIDLIIENKERRQGKESSRNFIPKN